MRQYLAIAKRDYRANGGSTLWLPAPVFVLLFAFFMTWLLRDINIKAWYFLGMTLICAYRMLKDLQLSHGHSFGFLAPRFKYYQFNYSCSLVFTSCLVTCVVFSDSILELLVSLSVLWFVVSFMFYFVKERYWRIAYIALLAAYLVSTFVSIMVEGLPPLSALLPLAYAAVWSVLSNPVVGIMVATTFSVLSFKSFFVARQHYLTPKEYDPQLLPLVWLKHARKYDNGWRLLLKPVMHSNVWDKIERAVLFGLDLGRPNTLLYESLFGAKVYSGVMTIALALMFALFLPYALYAALGFHPGAILYPVCIFMLAYLVTTTSVISIEWMQNRQAMTDLWLVDSSKTRGSYMLKLAMLFCERLGRVSVMCLSLFLIALVITSGMKDLLTTSLIALGTTLLGLMLQIAFVLFVTAKVAKIAWLKYLTFLISAINYAGLSALLFFSQQSNNYWLIAFSAVVCAALCYQSIKHWCAHDKELYQYA